MSIEEFPAIETFQKLPKRVIVKGGAASYAEAVGATLSGIVINNIGQTVCQVTVRLVVFNEQDIPLLNVSTISSPDRLPQGSVGSFHFAIEAWKAPLVNYYLYSTWKYDDADWEA